MRALRRADPRGWRANRRLCRMEWFRFVREHVWRNAGFASLRNIRGHIEDYEALFEPAVVPCDEAGIAPESGGAPQEPPPPAPASPWPPKYYSVQDYHALYLSEELTPTDVAAALLPLIRKDVEPRSPHAVAWFDAKADLVMKAAEASTLRYRAQRPLGVLDGVPTAVKDEYELEGYTTSLGSRNDYTGDVVEQGSTSSWCVRKLQEAAASSWASCTWSSSASTRRASTPSTARRATPTTPATTRAAARPAAPTPWLPVSSPLPSAATAAAASASRQPSAPSSA